jgi:hypothetical protein
VYQKFKVNKRFFRTSDWTRRLYECETWTLILKGRRTRVVVTREQEAGKKGPKGDEVTGGWFKLHHEEIHNLFCSRKMNKPRRMNWADNIASLREMRNAYNNLAG